MVSETTHKFINNIKSEGGNMSSLSRRRERTVFSEMQLETLEETFSEDHYPDYQKKADLAKKLSLSEQRVQVYFYLKSLFVFLSFLKFYKDMVQK